MRASRDIWIGAAMLAVAAAGIGLLVHSPNTAGPPFRLEGSGRLGLSGLGAGLRTAGFGVRSSLTPTIPDHGLTVSVEPVAISHDEASAWLRSIRAGAVVLLATDEPDPLTQAIGLRFGFPGEARPTAAGLATFPGLAPNRVPAATTFARIPAHAGVLIGTRTAAAMVVVPLGRGSVWVLSQPRVLTNAGIAGDGLAVALPLAERAGGGTVSVDAFHQGGSPTLGSLAYLPSVGAARDPRGRGDRDPGGCHRRSPAGAGDPRGDRTGPEHSRDGALARLDAPLGGTAAGGHPPARACIQNTPGRARAAGRGGAARARVRRVTRDGRASMRSASRKSRGG